jgi:Cytochrome c554 and c-prime
MVEPPSAFACIDFKGVFLQMKTEFSVRLVMLLALSVAGAVGCDQSPKTEQIQTTSKTIKTENAPPSPTKIDPEFVSADGTVDLQGKQPTPKDRVPDVIDDEKIEIPADAVFGTPTLAEPETTQAGSVGLTSSAPDAKSPEEKPAEEQSASPSVPAPDGPQKAVGIGNLASEEELNQKIAEDWKDPQVVFVLTGQQHGYLEPCGCTGLDRQKGGIIRRDTLIAQLRERGWEVLPLDVGNQVRKSFGLQPQIQFETTIKAFEQMKYKAVTFGVDDLKLSGLKLIETAGTEDAKKPREMISANAVVLDRSFWPQYKIIEVGKRKIGITGYLGDEFADEFKLNSELMIEKAEAALKLVVAKLKEQGCDYLVLLAHASQEDSERMAAAVPGFNLVVTAGGHGEPRNVLDPIPGSTALISQVGTKGMYACLVGVFDDSANPVRYQRVALSAQFKDSQPMFDIFKEYQMKLQSIVSREGFDGLGLAAQPHPSGRQFVGSDECSGCHSKAFEIWKNSPHFHATDSIVTPPNDRGAIPRHFDPECVVCHVTGWNVKSVSPYETGYASLAATPNMLGSGCENCHGPGSEHVKVENGDIEADDVLRNKIREQMRLTMADAKDKCVECHDLDNSPDFHAGPGQFMDYWERARPGFGPVKHLGKD